MCVYIYIYICVCVCFGYNALVRAKCKVKPLRAPQSLLDTFTCTGRKTSYNILLVRQVIRYHLHWLEDKL